MYVTGICKQTHTKRQTDTHTHTYTHKHTERERERESYVPGPTSTPSSEPSALFNGSGSDH